MDFNVTFRCRKCRVELFVYPETSLISTHGHEIRLKNDNLSAKVEYEEVAKANDRKFISCSPLAQELLFIDETCIPNWMRSNLDQGEWTKGKLLCPRCNARVGSFDFVSGFHCNCQFSVVPPIRLVKSKMDTVLLHNINKI